MAKSNQKRLGEYREEFTFLHLDGWEDTGEQNYNMAWWIMPLETEDEDKAVIKAIMSSDGSVELFMEVHHRVEGFIAERLGTVIKGQSFPVEDFIRTLLPLLKGKLQEQYRTKRQLRRLKERHENDKMNLWK